MQAFMRQLIAAICLQAIFISAKRPDFVTDEMMQLVANDKVRCMKEHGATEELIDEVNNGHTPNERSLTCYMYCLLESLSLVDEDGVLEQDMLIGFLPQTLQAAATEIVPGCAATTGDDVCDKMYQVATCLQQKRADLFFMV